jgi:lysophospholipase L1-like esterase
MSLIRYTPRLAAITVLAAVTLELCARLDDYIREGAPLAGVYSIANLFEFDAIGQKGRPGARFGKWRMNSLGFRGPEPAPNRQIILAAGSSETFGQYESEGKQWPEQLAQRIEARRPGAYTVINTALAGETLPTTLKRLPGHLQRLKPAAVILYPSLAHYLQLPFIPPYSGPPPTPRFALRIQGRAETLLKASLPEFVQAFLRARQIDREAALYQPPASNMPPALQQRFAADLAQAISIIRAHGATPVVVSHVHRFGKAVSPEERYMLLTWRRFYPMLAEEAFLPMEETMNSILRQTAAAQGVRIVDPVPTMPTGPRYFADFVHFTDEGAAAFSNLVFNGISDCLDTAAFVCPHHLP